MPNQQLLDYIKPQLASGVSPDQIKRTLLESGWQETDINEALQSSASAGDTKQPQSSTEQNPQEGSEQVQGGGIEGQKKKDPFSDLFVIDSITKETITASVIGMVIANLIIYVGDLMFSYVSYVGIVFTVIYGAIYGAIGGFIIAKFYHVFMDFCKKSLGFVYPYINSLFKVLFVPIVVTSLISAFYSILIGGAAMAVGAGMGGIAGGAVGGMIGASVIVSSFLNLGVMIVARFVYAKFMVHRVGNYYK